MSPSPVRGLCVFGTRPESIKMAPVVKALAADPRFDVRVCVTGQHREMLAQVLDVFGITPDHDLAVMAPGQDLADVTSKVLLGMRGVLRDEKPDVVLVHGDTTTCFAAGLAAFYERVPVAHVEAGLRTGDLDRPWPEELNRVLVGRFACLHFAPTERAASNLTGEGVDPETVHVTGNTVVDALLDVAGRVAGEPAAAHGPELGPELAAGLDRDDAPSSSSPDTAARASGRASRTSAPASAASPSATRTGASSIPYTSTRTCAGRSTKPSVTSRTST